MSVKTCLSLCGLGLAAISWGNVHVVRADDAVIQRFGSWTVTIQPGVRAEGVIIPPAPKEASPFRLISQTEPFPVDQIPPSPAAPVSDEQSPPNTAVPSADPLALVHRYSQVYNAIPFSRAEYAANPSYRHDATMEFLFGQMRNTVIQRGTTVIRHQGGGFMSSPSASPYFFPFYNNPYSYPYNTGSYRPYHLW